jgi:NO-binding membrane sensor protein with MHYT domain
VAQVHHFTYGWLTPTLAYLLSYLGALLGLVATARARQSTSGGTRARWLVLGAWAIGGTGIWVMHFMAMIGFTVDNASIDYDATVTIASWLIAVIVVGLGLFIVGFGRPSVAKVLAAGLFTGLGVAGMHYTGMAAMRMDASVHYDRTRVILSVVIAVVAATAALWFTLVVRRARWIGVIAAIMAVAVSGMHYTAMSAMSVRLTGGDTAVAGTDALSFIPPILIFVLLVVIALLYAVLADPSADERQWDAEREQREQERADDRQRAGNRQWGGGRHWTAERPWPERRRERPADPSPSQPVTARSRRPGSFG